MRALWNEFKQFAMRGNVVDLAVAVVVGASFNKIVSSLVDDLLMPVIGILLGKLDFRGLQLQVGEAVVRYGNYIQTVVDFLIIAFAVFMLVRIVTTPGPRWSGRRKRGRPPRQRPSRRRRRPRSSCCWRKFATC